MILFSDVHLRPETEAVVFDQVLPGIWRAFERDGGPLVCLGDLFHIRYQVDVRVFNRLRDVLREWGAAVPVFLLPGNHDQYNLEGRNILESLGDIPGVTVFNEPQWTELGLWVPYRKNLELVREAIALKRPKSSAAVLFMHQEVLGGWMNNHKQSDEGLESTGFTAFDYVFSGHWHKGQHQPPNVYYVGSTHQTKADEAGQDKGYVLWDGQSLQRVPVRWGPRYHNLRVADDGSLDTSDVEAGDIVQVIAPPGSDIEEFAKSLEGTQHAISVEVEPIEQRLNVGPQASLEQYAKAYVDLKVDDPAMQQALMAEFQTIISGVSA